MTVEEDYTPARSRERLLAAMSAAGMAITNIAETLRDDGGVEGTLEAGIGWTDQDAFLPLQEDVLEPLIDALRLTIHAIGLPDPTHRISLALDAFTAGDD